MKPPSGNVTFLFTDIEGSTRLAQEFPESLPAALEKHHAIIHKVIESNNGFVFEIVGDAFCCAFEKAEDAVKAAVEAQINLANEKWYEVSIKIRIGIHSGNAEWNGKRYMGYITLARTARVMSSAYGEQIIISNDTYELSVPKLEFGNESSVISFRDLGERRLKDLKQPVRLFQILYEGLREDFPPLKTLDARPNNLPVQLTSFIGREAEMKTVKDLLMQTHLLTLTGSGGAGKTRLALQVAADVIDDFANGVWFVELASFSEPAFLPQAIMKVFDIKEEPKRSLEDTLCDYLRDKEILIILDNCEHLVEGCAKLTEKLLSNSPKLKIISTSREGLRCGGEQTHRVLSLEVPDPKDEDTPEKLSQYESVRLFIERALAVDSTFRVNNNNAPSLAEICFQLDGIPLAIELAAARTKVLSVEQIFERLNDRFNLLTGGKRTALPRQQTLRALIDWSYDLLSEKEKILWRRLSVFAGGWTLEAAEEICSDEKIKKEEMIELLNQLTEKSIIIFEREKERYRILETIRQFGEKKLKENNQWKIVTNNHLKFYLESSSNAEEKLKIIEEDVLFEIFELEINNLEKAIQWSLEGGDKEQGFLLSVVLGKFWERCYLSTGLFWLEKVLLNNQSSTNSTRARALNFAGGIARLQGEFDKAEKFITESIDLSEKSENKFGIATSFTRLGNIELGRGNIDLAKKYFKDAFIIYKKVGYKYGIATTLMLFGNIENNRGNFEKSSRLLKESLSIYKEIGYKCGIADCLKNLAVLFSIRREYELAKLFNEESLSMYKQIKNKSGISKVLNDLGQLAKINGDNTKAVKLITESCSMKIEMGDKLGAAASMMCLGGIALDNGDFDKAKKIYMNSLTVGREKESKLLISLCLNDLGYIFFMEEKIEQAKECLEESVSLNLRMGDKININNNILGLIGVFAKQREEKKATTLLGFVEKNFPQVSELHGISLIIMNRIITLLKNKFTNEEFTKYYEDGKKLTLEQAADLALSSIK